MLPESTLPIKLDSLSLNGSETNSTPASSSFLNEKKLPLSALCCFPQAVDASEHHLHLIIVGIAMIFTSLHEFIIVYTFTASFASEAESRSACRTVKPLFRKKAISRLSVEGQSLLG